MTHELLSEVRERVNAHLDAVERVLIGGGHTRQQRRAIMDDLESQILDMLAAGNAKATLADVDAVLSRLDPPSAYADLRPEVQPCGGAEDSAPASGYSRAGIASLVIFATAGIGELALLATAMDRRMPSWRELFAFLGWAGLLASFLGVGLGIFGVCQKGRKRATALAGLVLNGVVVLVALGWILTASTGAPSAAPPPPASISSPSATSDGNGEPLSPTSLPSAAASRPSAGSLASVRITCLLGWPGCVPQWVDGQVAMPLFRQLGTIPGLVKMTSDSTYGRADIWLAGGGESGGPDLLRAAQKIVNDLKPELPAADIQVRLLDPPRAIPEMTPKQVDGVRVELDREKLLAWGLNEAEVDEQIGLGPAGISQVSAPPTAETLQAMARIPLRPVEGRNVVLGDVATITIEKAPDRIIRSFP